MPRGHLKVLRNYYEQPVKNNDVSRTWFIRTYDIESIFGLPFGISKYAWIYHDKDVNEDGSLKAPHYHVFIRFCVPCCSSQISPLGHVSVVHKGGEVHCLEYLTHYNTPNKVQYPFNEVHSNYDWKAKCQVKAAEENDIDSLQQAVIMLLNGHSVAECVHRFGRDFIIHYNAIRNLVYDVNYDSNNN